MAIGATIYALTPSKDGLTLWESQYEKTNTLPALVKRRASFFEKEADRFRPGQSPMKANSIAKGDEWPMNSESESCRFAELTKNIWNDIKDVEILPGLTKHVGNGYSRARTKIVQMTKATR